jgi:copper chaperone CopZ
MKTHTATVTFDPARTTPETLVAAVSNTGFTAKVLRNGS